MKLFSYVTLGLLASTEASKYKVWCENGDFRARFQQQTEKKNYRILKVKTGNICSDRTRSVQ